MLKGINRNVLVVNTDKDSNFETVYFIIKRGTPRDRGDILKEAAAIISRASSSQRKNNFRRQIAFLLLGAVIGVAVCSLVCLMLVSL